jgi:secernin
MMCDTFVARGRRTADGSVIFGKNSDRVPNEAQPLEHHPPAEYPPGAELRCTWIAIPQARRTLGILISRPHWTWGAEMGANDAGLVIGNEAVFTRMPKSRAPGLIGMDILRLALERAGTAREAIDLIADLLARRGQGGMHSATMVYHNSFLLADPSEAWVLETAGSLWAAARAGGDVQRRSHGAFHWKVSCRSPHSTIVKAKGARMGWTVAWLQSGGWRGHGRGNG